MKTSGYHHPRTNIKLLVPFCPGMPNLHCRINVGGKRAVPVNERFRPPHISITLYITPLITLPISIQMTQNEGRIDLAIQAFKQGQFKHLKTACKAYNAPYITIRKRVAGVPQRRVSTPNGRKLMDLEEQTLE
jgi:hypothetical protein